MNDILNLMKKFCLFLVASLMGLCIQAADEVSFSMEVVAGQQWKMTISLENAQEYSAFQMDVVLPEGFTYEEGGIAATDRTSGFDLQAVVQSSGNVRVVGYSRNGSIANQSGGLLTLTLLAPENLADGSYKVVLKNVRFSDSAGVETVLSGISSSFVIADGKPVDPGNPGSGVEKVTSPTELGIYTLQGVRIQSNSLQGIKPGVYVIDGRKTLVR